MIGDIVAVQAFPAHLKVRRRINIAHSQINQIRHDLTRLRKREPAIKLQSVRAGRNPRVIARHSAMSRHSERSRGCNAADQVREARLSTLWRNQR